jgi:hypothetical protein
MLAYNNLFLLLGELSAFAPLRDEIREKSFA